MAESRENLARARMTLIAYIRCRDGCILISDRQASEVSGHSQENKKTFVSETKEFAIAGAGYGFDVLSIFSVLTHDVTVVGSNVVERLRQAIQDYCERSGPYSNPDVRVKALLIARQDEGLVPYEVRIQGSAREKLKDRIGVDRNGEKRRS